MNDSAALAELLGALREYEYGLAPGTLSLAPHAPSRHDDVLLLLHESERLSQSLARSASSPPQSRASGGLAYYSARPADARSPPRVLSRSSSANLTRLAATASATRHEPYPREPDPTSRTEAAKLALKLCLLEGIWCIVRPTDTGFQLLSIEPAAHCDTNTLASSKRYCGAVFESMDALLNSLSPRYRDKFHARLFRRLQLIATHDNSLGDEPG
ncbi:hypothetical protein HK105_204917 [Polyrhizophydium stewartii]|uniref:GSKIP domain-containing protein n=1 Tax=Polyrhizophydium stewartii TaxID=2732419 RepID=A0ABR4N7P4_9FUNG